MIEYKLWRDFKSLGRNDQGYPEYEHMKSGIVMVLLPGGEFMMGSPEDEPGRGGDEYLHKVRLSPFMIAKYEVSRAIWKKIAENDPHYRMVEQFNFPVSGVSWDDCFGGDKSFCKKVGLSLPTEAQWEYACRGGTSGSFAFGDKIYIDQVNYWGLDAKNEAPPGSGRFKTVPVNSFEANGYGLHNMHGNVWEWCLDIYDKEYYLSENSYKGDVPSKTGTPDPTDLLIHYVLRGGSYNNDWISCRSASRFGRSTQFLNYDYGFRPVYNLASSR